MAVSALFAHVDLHQDQFKRLALDQRHDLGQVIQEYRSLLSSAGEGDVTPNAIIQFLQLFSADAIKK